MAIATLSLVYNNPDVFRGVVKIRKGLACRMILQCGELDKVLAWFSKFAADIARRVPPRDPSSARTAEACQAVMDATRRAGRGTTRTSTLSGTAKAGRALSPGGMLVLVAVPAALAAWAYAWGRRCVYPIQDGAIGVEDDGPRYKPAVSWALSNWRTSELANT